MCLVCTQQISIFTRLYLSTNILFAHCSNWNCKTEYVCIINFWCLIADATYEYMAQILASFQTRRWKPKKYLQFIRILNTCSFLFRYSLPGLAEGQFGILSPLNSYRAKLLFQYILNLSGRLVVYYNFKLLFFLQAYY